MTKEDKYQKFMSYVQTLSGYEASQRFKTSEPTIKRYKSGKVEIPDHVILIIDLYSQINNLNKKIDLIEFERIGEKQVIKDFQDSFKKVLDLK